MAEQEEDSGEKEFQASEQKLKQARDDGNIPQSKETNAFAVIIGLICAAAMLKTGSGTMLFGYLAQFFVNADGYSTDIFSSGGKMTLSLMSRIVLQLLPMLALLASFVLVTLIITRSFTVSAKKIKPELKKISPVENFMKKYGPRGLLDFAKDMTKMLVAGAIATVFLFGFAQNYYGSTALNTENLAGFTFDQVIRVIGLFAMFQFALALVDFPMQWQMHANRQKMTREELKKENKQSEGDPAVKQSRRQRAQEISRGDMLQSVKSSTVVIVNPEHYAVALIWDPGSEKAPIVVAKGIDSLAAKIREIAAAHDVPIYRDPPITRSIYRSVEIDQEIKPEHFAAVAAAIQFVGRVSKTGLQER
jgi:flagellar biosynthetic protein FlhB